MSEPIVSEIMDTLNRHGQGFEEDYYTLSLLAAAVKLCGTANGVSERRFREVRSRVGQHAGIIEAAYRSTTVQEV